MKKILFTIIFLFVLSLKSNADILPQYLNSVYHWGIGVASTSKHIKIYEENNSDSKVKAEIVWNEHGAIKCSNTKMICDSKDIFLGFSPSNNTALLSVEDETDKWIYVCYSQKQRLFGWIKKSENTTFLNWSDLFLIYGKKYGMYLFRDTPKEQKRLFAGPSVESGSVDSFFYPTFISPWFVSGNWVLVKIEDFDDKQKTGWLRFRGDDGRLNAFVNLK